VTHGSPTNQSRAGRSLDFGAVWICQRATGAHALTKSGELELLTMVRFHRKSWLSLLCVLATVGCSKTKQLPVAPAPPPPPQVTEVFPAARSTQVDYASAIRVQFDAPVNPSSVDPRNVYLKIDTVRQPIALSLDAGSRTIRVIPQSTLSLFTTYTVELSPALQFADGQRLGNTYLWQFTTVSVRHPVPLAPHDRGFDSPFAPLLWGGNESTAGMLIYDLYEGTDSVTIDHRGLPTIYRGGGTRYIPNTRWPGLGPNFWAVTIENLTSGERSDGPVWRFDTPTADAPVDSLVVSARNWGYRAGAGGCICDVFYLVAAIAGLESVGRGDPLGHVQRSRLAGLPGGRSVALGLGVRSGLQCVRDHRSHRWDSRRALERVADWASHDSLCVRHAKRIRPRHASVSWLLRIPPHLGQDHPVRDSGQRRPRILAVLQALLLPSFAGIGDGFARGSRIESAYEHSSSWGASDLERFVREALTPEGWF